MVIMDLMSHLWEDQSYPLVLGRHSGLPSGICPSCRNPHIFSTVWTSGCRQGTCGEKIRTIITIIIQISCTKLHCPHFLEGTLKGEALSGRWRTQYFMTRHSFIFNKAPQGLVFNLSCICYHQLFIKLRCPHLWNSLFEIINFQNTLKTICGV